jgi:hypothetical protein
VTADRRALVAILALALQGCVSILFPPDTFDDMWRRLDSVAPPGEFALIAKHRGGLRSDFMAAGPPFVVEHYSAPWEGGALCNRLRDLLEEFGSTAVEEERSGSCGYRTTISAGWRARFANVWRYELAASALAPDAVAKYLTAEECAEIRKRHEEQSDPLPSMT